MSISSPLTGIAQDQSLKRIQRQEARFPSPHQTRRRWDTQHVTDFNASAIPTASYGYGMMVDLTEFSELIIEVVGTSLVLGPGAGLKMQLQLLSPKNANYFNRPVDAVFTANPTAVLTPAAGTTSIAAFIVPPPFGGMVQVGFTCTTAFTSGQIGATLHLKG
jgi:hypothetical protein